MIKVCFLFIGIVFQFIVNKTATKVQIITDSSKQLGKKLKKNKRMIAHPLLVPLLFGGARGCFPLANTAGNPQAGGDGGQDGRNGLNDEFPSILLHGVH